VTDRVRRTPELERILTLPRRDISADPEHTARLVEDLTDVLKTPNGTMRLRDVQAHALHDIGTIGGGFLPIGVGEGKTLISLLAPYVLDAKRPMLLLPAGLIEKTVRDRERLAPHWLIPNHLRLFSYEMLGREQSAIELETYQPDVVICDEVQCLKNMQAACVKRVARRMANAPHTRFVAMTGSPIDRSVLEIWHILLWALKEAAPVPINDNEITEWSLAIDEKIDENRRYEPGALLELAPTDPAKSEIERARDAFRRRLVETPGVVATSCAGERVGASIYVRDLQYKMRPITDQHFAKLRSEMRTPDDWDVEPVDVWRHARELALGFHMIWDPRPPEEWREARRAWFAYVRQVLARSNHLDSPSPVESAVLSGELRGEGAEILARWREIEPTFTPNPVPVWHDDSAIDVCAKWMAKRGPAGVVWTAHVPFAERLAEKTGAMYFGQNALAADGTHVEDGPKGESIIASIDACGAGFNLQGDVTRDHPGWSRMLFTAIRESPTEAQQAIAREHRPGQRADEVIVDVLLGCAEHGRAFNGCLAATRAVQQTTGAEQKLLLADIEFPSDDEIASFTGPRWRAPATKRFEIPGCERKAA
jgi:hypothetical protein